MPDGDITWRARELREAAGVSQRAMARHVGVAQSTLAGWERGAVIRYGLAKPHAARRWRAALRLLERTNPPPGPPAVIVVVHDHPARGEGTAPAPSDATGPGT